MAKTYITLDTRIDTWKDEFNNLVNKVGDLGQLTTSGSGDSDLVQAINEHSAELGAITASDMSTTASTVSTAIKEHALELGTITAGAMGTTASTVSTAIAELDAEADSDRSNFANNIRTIMLDPAGTGTSREVTASANNSTDETTFLTFVDGATGSQGIETDTGLTYNPSTGLITAVSLTAATLNISGNVDIAGITNLDVVDIDGAVDLDNTLTVGEDDTGYDVKFFGDAASAFMQWDASADDLILSGTAGLIVPDGKLTLGSTALTSTAAELNLLDGVSGLAKADFTKLAEVDATSSELNLLNSVSGLVKADFTKLAEVNATSTELNLIDGGTSRGTTAVASGDGILINDDGQMRMTNVDTVATYFASIGVGGSNIVTTGALNSGSIDSNFGSINVGSSSITTTGTISGGSVIVGGADLNSTELGILDGANITTAELNTLDGDTSASSITVVDGDRFVMNDAGTMKQVAASTLKSYFGQQAGGTAITILDIDGGTDIGAALADDDLLIVDDGAGGTNRKVEISSF
jgi:hypothetical protein